MACPNFLESGRDADASSLIATLKNDPDFPERLNSSLEELQAYSFYKAGMWDSSATHLVKALDRAKTGQERARWEFLAAQMFERSGKNEEAEKLYVKAIGHTTDPVMDIYSRLNVVKMNKASNENSIEKNIAELLKMSKRDKYVDYRDVIYFMLAQMELERNNPLAAQDYLLKGSKFNNGNIGSKSKAFLQIADLSFSQKKYLQSASFYDSLEMNDFKDEEFTRIENRKAMLSELVPYLKTIAEQDSLQKIASMPETEREEFIKKLVKRLRKQQGLDDEGVITTVRTLAPPDLFTTPSKGEWYFYNSTLKTTGAQQFKQIWGNRANVDNWRRASDAMTALRNTDPKNTRTTTPGTIADPASSLTYTALLNNLPLTAVQLQASNDSLQNALFSAALVYLNQMDDYPSAIDALEQIRTRYPAYDKMPEALFHLYYAYTKMGNASDAAKIKRLLAEKYPTSKASDVLTNGVSTKNTDEATKTYEAVYDLFIEGNFTEAKEAKKRADSIYKTTNWQPQLLYIEAVYHIREREDSIARQILQTLVNQNPNTPIAGKAGNLMAVLSRRAQIEDELSKLQVERPVEDSVDLYKTFAPKTDNISKEPTKVVVNNPVQGKKDSVVTRPQLPPVKTNTLYTYKPDVQHYAVVVLNKVDKVFGNEARNAFFRFNREKFTGQPLNLQLVELDAENKLLLIGEFGTVQTAVDYVQRAKPLAPSEILPWLKADKYSFSIISVANLEVLKSNPDINLYRKFLEQNLPVKF